MEKFKKNLIVVLTSLVFSLSFGFTGLNTAHAYGSPTTVNLGTAANFTILSKTKITTTGATSISGDIGISPAAASILEGFSPTLDISGAFSTSTYVTGRIYASDYVEPTPTALTAAVSAMEAAYTNASGRTQDELDRLGGTLPLGTTFTTGIYKWGTNVNITGDITLSGSATDVWIFIITGNLDISSATRVLLSGGALPANVFWAVAGTTTLETTSTFEGNILGGPATSTIAMLNGAMLHGKALGQKNITLIANIVGAADIVPPTITIGSNKTTLKKNETAAITFTLSEVATNFDATDVTVAGGLLSAFAGSGTSYTATFTPTDNSTALATIDVATSKFTDPTGNLNVAATQKTMTVDTIAPTVTITMNNYILTTNGTSLVTFTFSEAPVGFTIDDVTSFPNGVLSAFAGSGTSYTATFTPNASINDATNVITVGTAWTDAAGNTGIGADSPNFTINTVASGGGLQGTIPVAVVPPLIDVVKVPNPLALPAGPGPVTYTYTVKNIGIVPMTNITLVGDTCVPIVLAAGDTNGDAILAVNETWIYRCSTILPATHKNTVVATGWANGISAVDVANATVVVGASIVPPLIHVTKIPSPLALIGGGTVTYTYTVTNPGTVPLSNVNITDDKCTGLPGRVLGHPGDLNKNNLLESNETWTFTCQTNLTKTTTNTATASGTANGLTATDFALATVVVPTTSAATETTMSSDCSGGNLYNTSTGALCVNNAGVEIPGCGDRTTGFSTASGLSCIGNRATTGITYNLGTATLGNGSSGDAVMELQRFLNAKLNLGLVVDGKLGPKTIAVIKTWQADNGLVADGLVGPKTKAKMNVEAENN
jgi:hypothetical protein